MSSSSEDERQRDRPISKLVKSDVYYHNQEDYSSVKEEKLRKKLKKKYKKHELEAKIEHEKKLFAKMVDRLKKEKYDDDNSEKDKAPRDNKESLKIKKRKSRHSSESGEEDENRYPKKKKKSKRTEYKSDSDSNTVEFTKSKPKHKHKTDKESSHREQTKYSKYNNDHNYEKSRNDSKYGDRKNSDKHDHKRTSKRHHDNQSADQNFKQRRSGWDQETVDDEGDRNRDANRGTRNHIREWDKGKDDRNVDYGRRPSNQNSNDSKAKEKKEEPNFKLSGKLTEYTNTYNGVVIMYNEPAEARKPKTRWRLYPFKGDESLQMLQLHRQSAFLFGRDRKIADIPVDHPSCSKQHAVLQFRLVDHEKDDGTIGRRVKPYMIDLESTNGTFVNNKRIEARRYVELMEKDVLKFGFSSRDYVILHEKSKEDKVDSEDGGENDDEDDEKARKMKQKKK